MIEPMPIRGCKQAWMERAVFNAYLGVHTTFAKTVSTFEQPEAEFPDILVHLHGGDQVPFEIAEWLHPEQMRRSIRRERLTDAMLEAIGEQGENLSQHFDFVLIFPRTDYPRFAASHARAFREQIWALLEDTERRWPHERSWHSQQGCLRQDLDAYPVLQSYISQLRFYPRQNEPLAGVPWIEVSVPYGSYSSNTAIDALASILKSKIERYGGLHRKPRLIVFYGAGIAYNTPWYDINFRTFGDVAKKAAQLIEGQIEFENVYLLEAVEPGPVAFEIYPNFTQCW